MTQYIFINKIHVQDANCVAGLTWGFPAITGFTGFAHALSLKIKKSDFSKICIEDKIMVVAHNVQPHSYEDDYHITRFSQKRGANFYSDTEKGKQSKTMTRIEEGRMDMVISLLIPISGRVGANSKNAFIDYINRCISTMRIAGGSVISISELEVLTLDSNNMSNQMLVKRKLMPGYILTDASQALEQHCSSPKNSGVDLIDAWLDFSSIKFKARPANNLISAYFAKLTPSDDGVFSNIVTTWQNHLSQLYQQPLIPIDLIRYFTENQGLIPDAVLQQWLEYCKPNSETKAEWEYVAKPQQGYLVPIMNGYRRISEDVSNIENLRGVRSTREVRGDFENAYFVEAIYSVAEWKFVRKLNFENLNEFFWAPKRNDELGVYVCTKPNTI